MENHLRLAEARGSLVAPNSPVQDHALRMCLILRSGEKEKARLDSIKVAMLNATPSIEKTYGLFPEFFPEDWEQQQVFIQAVNPETGEFDPDMVDDSKVDWRSEGITESEDETLSRWIAQRESGSVSAQDLGEGWM